MCVHLFDFFLRRSRKVDGSDAATHAHNAHWGHKRKAIKKTWKKLKNLRESLQIAEEIHQESGTLSKDSRRVRPTTNGHKQATPPPILLPSTRILLAPTKNLQQKPLNRILKAPLKNIQGLIKRIQSLINESFLNDGNEKNPAGTSS